MHAITSWGRDASGYPIYAVACNVDADEEHATFDHDTVTCLTCKSIIARAHDVSTE